MYIAIEGVIGVGKTTLARLLQPSLKTELLLEVFEENPFLSNFYADRERYAFQTQMFFLLSRYRQQRSAVPQILADGQGLISDYTFEKDALFAQINLKGDELEMYFRLHEALAEKIPLPNLVVYLRAEPMCSCSGLPYATGATNGPWNGIISMSSTAPTRIFTPANEPALRCCPLIPMT
jgi:deoxyguanosine kinase